MKTVSLQRGDKDKQDARAQIMGAVVVGGRGGDYPVHLRVDEPELKKLGIVGTPQQDDVYRIEGEMKVGGVNTHNDDRCVDFVLTNFGVEPKTAKPDKSLRETIEDAHHQARGTLAPSIGARFVSKK